MDIEESTTAIVVGGASGLGRATVTRLAALGTKVAIFDNNPDTGQALADAIDAIFHRVDVTDEGSIDVTLDALEDRRSVARILVNCAGISPVAKTIDQDGLPDTSDLFSQGNGR